MASTTPPVGDQSLPPAGPPGPGPGAAPRTEPGQQGQYGRPGRPADDGFFDSMRRVGVVRTQDRWIGGVAGGIARRFGVDPLLVRGLLGVTVLLGGAGLILYGLAWALLPEETDGRIHLQETFAGRFDAAILGALAFVIIGTNRGAGPDPWDPDGFGWLDGLLWVGLLVGLVAVVVSATTGRRGPRVGSGGPTGPDDPPVAGWAAPAPPPRSGSRAVPHPGYGAVPLSSPAPPPPPAPAWSGPAPASSAWPAPAPADPGGRPSDATAPRAPGPMPSPSPYGAPPPRPLPPPRPRVLGPGVGMVGTVVGLTLLALAALLVVEREGELGQSVALTALGVGVVLAGLGILVSGLRGRRSGVLGFLAIVAVLATVPAAVVPDTDAEWAFLVGDAERAGISSGETWRPGTVEEARRGLAVGVGDVDVDLTALPLDQGHVEVPISMGAGDLEVVVPADVAVTGAVVLHAGETRWEVDGLRGVAGLSGGNAPEHFQSDEVSDGDAVRLALVITAGAGEVRVVEEVR